MASSITIQGDRALEHRLAATGSRAHHQEPVLRAQGHAAARAVTGVPVDTGRLAAGVRSAQVKVGPWGFVLLTDVPYARYVFRGTPTMEARPPVVPASVGANTAKAISSDLAHVR